MKVSLPWPPRELSPNARGHWAIKARAAKSHKTACQLLCMAAGARSLGWPAMVVAITFHPPSARRADLDNMLAAMKSGLDGVAQATSVDDSRWEYRIARGDPTKGGRVDVEISQP